MYSVYIYNRVCRACWKDGMSVRAAARYFDKDRKTIAKMLRHELPPAYSINRGHGLLSHASQSMRQDVEQANRRTILKISTWQLSSAKRKSTLAFERKVA